MALRRNGPEALAGRPVRILLLDVSRFHGPSARDHVQLMRHLAPQEFQVTFLGNSHGETAGHVRALPHVRVHTADFMPDVEGKGWRRIAFVLWRGTAFGIGIARSMWLARQWRPDIIHGGLTKKMVLLQHPLRWVTGAKLIACLHRDPEARRGLRQRFYGWSLRHSDMVITVSEWVRSRVIDLGVAPEKVVAILNVADPDRFHPGISGERIRREYGIPQDAPLVVLIGRVFPWKGQGDLVEAMALVRQRVPDARALIVGWDEPRRGGGPAYRRRLLERAKELGMEGAIIVDEARPDAPEIMAASDVVAAPSTEDPCPLTVLEAMSSGRPVVGYRSGGIPEELGEENAEWLAEPGDIAGLADRLATLLEDEDLRKSVGRRNRLRVEQHFYEPRLAEETAQVYRGLLGIPESARPSKAAA